MLQFPSEIIHEINSGVQITDDMLAGYINNILAYNKLPNTPENREAAKESIADFIKGGTKLSTTDLEEAIALWGKNNVAARVRCSYAELYLAGGRKVFSLQKSADINNAKNFLLLVSGSKANGFVELSLTKLGYDYLCEKISNNKKTDGVYSELWPYMFISTPDGGYQKSYRPIKLYAPGLALRYFPANTALAPSLNDEQGTIISNYEVDEHNQQVQDDINKKREELERKKKQILILSLAAGAVSLFAFN